MDEHSREKLRLKYANFGQLSSSIFVKTSRRQECATNYIKEEPDVVQQSTTDELNDTADPGTIYLSSDSGEESGSSPTPWENKLNNAPLSYAIKQYLTRQQPTEELISDSDDCTIISLDDASLVSQRSGATEARNLFQDLRLSASCDFLNLNRREKRLFKTALDKGHSRQTAKTPLYNSYGKRRSSDYSPNCAHAKRLRRTSPGVIRLGIISATRSLPLTAEHIAMLKAVILQTIITCPCPDGGPQFEGCVPRSDWLLLLCVNNITANWVRANFATIRVKSSLDIELLEETQLPRSHLVKGFFPNSADLANETVLEYIGTQNSLDTKRWKVLHRTIHGTKLHLAMIVDEQSLKTLSERNGKVWYCFGKVKLILRSAGRKDQTTVRTTATVGEAEVNDTPQSAATVDEDPINTSRQDEVMDFIFETSEHLKTYDHQLQGFRR